VVYYCMIRAMGVPIFRDGDERLLGWLTKISFEI